MEDIASCSMDMAWLIWITWEVVWVFELEALRYDGPKVRMHECVTLFHCGKVTLIAQECSNGEELIVVLT